MPEFNVNRIVGGFQCRGEEVPLAPRRLSSSSDLARSWPQPPASVLIHQRSVLQALLRAWWSSSCSTTPNMAPLRLSHARPVAIDHIFDAHAAAYRVAVNPSRQKR